MKKSIGAKTLVYPTPVFLVGTYDAAGKPNVMAAAWGSICCSSPPCLSVALRKATYTYGNIVARKAFTVSIASEEQVAAADYFGIVSGKNTDKFADTGLTAVKSELVDAPYVGEFPLAVECSLLHVLEIGLHTLFVGEVKDVKAEETVLGEDGMPRMELVRPLIYAPVERQYYGVGSHLGKAFSVGNVFGKKRH